MEIENLEHCIKFVQLIILVIFLGTVVWDFRSGYTRRTEIHDAISTQYGLVRVELKALWDDIENHSDDEVRLKCEELARREAVITEWAKEAETWR